MNHRTKETIELLLKEVFIDDNSYVDEKVARVQENSFYFCSSALAHRMVHLMLASLLYSHAWKLEDGMKPENIDMSEKFGLTLQKAQPLRAIPMKV
ncbi:Geraniol 8-hydroxylase [Vitis vinifera]|uniref:Geraniol 8-hydroxylase n=1 Tax=Vitis vinifera TaxID=29760 RepID=A0A438IWH3_VITVI|nr:Geraniol 8-hydroxylase [Vitis vinifera]